MACFYTALAFLAAALSLAGVRTLIAMPVAKVGDTIRFGGHYPVQVQQGLKVQARIMASLWSQSGQACILDTSALSHPQATLTVVAVHHEDVLLDVAAAANPSPGEDCPAGATVAVSSIAYQQLQGLDVPAPSYEPTPF